LENVFVNPNSHSVFKWENLGDIKEGRQDLGEEMPVLVYRLMQYTLLDVLAKDFGHEKANDYFRRAGHLAGTQFAMNVLDLKVDFDTFVANLQKVLQELSVGILRMEEFNESTGELVLTVAQDLDCSGLPVTDETVCNYDEGFIAGILAYYTGKKFDVSEIDCWATGGRVCRFDIKLSNKQ